MDQIFDLVFYSEGGFTFTEIYEMPINLRSYYYAKLAKILEDRANQQKQQQEQSQKGRR